MIAEDSISSRIFVKNLPHSASIEDFRTHFSQYAPISDARHFPQRRIGYVGYRTAEAALQAVKYYNKSFMGSARLKVELARPAPADRKRQQPVLDGHKAVHRDPAGSNEDEKSIRAKIEPNGIGAGRQASNHDVNLHQFLDTMQASSKSQTWRDQTENSQDFSSQPQAHPTDAASGKPAGPAQPPPTAVKESQPIDETEPNIGSTKAQIAADVEQSLSDVEPERLQKLQPSDLSGPDSDWLLSRKSRTLGLVDGNDDQLAAHFATPAERSNGLRTGVPFEECNANCLDKEIQFEESRKKDISTISQLPSPRQEVLSESPQNQKRLFMRNLTYTIREEDIVAHLKACDCQNIQEVKIARGSNPQLNKGFGYIEFDDAESASIALSLLDQRPLQGRLLHVMLSDSRDMNGQMTYDLAQLPYKKQLELKRKREVDTGSSRWNSIYMSSDAILSSVSARLQVPKSELLDATSSGAAVQQALAETHVIQETKAFFLSHGINFEDTRTKKRSETIMLVKNFPFGTSTEELRNAFTSYGEVAHILVPPSATIAIVQFSDATGAKAAYANMAYRKFHGSILFLEKAPEHWEMISGGLNPLLLPQKQVKHSAKDVLRSADEDLVKDPSSTIFVRNLNFSTTTSDLEATFRPLDGYVTAVVKTRDDPKNLGHILSMGYGFIQFRSGPQALTALQAMQNVSLHGHQLSLEQSRRRDAVEVQASRATRDQGIDKNRTKLIIKNLPFETTKKDIRELFGKYGQLRSVRLPQKFDKTTRGFAFANFVTPREAENALEALTDTHLLGRRLVMEFAADEALDPEAQISAMQQKIGEQSNRVALHKLTTGSARKRLNVEEQGEDGV